MFHILGALSVDDVFVKRGALPNTIWRYPCGGLQLSVLLTVFFVALSAALLESPATKDTWKDPFFQTPTKVPRGVGEHLWGPVLR